MPSVLQVQQLYTADILLLEAYFLPMANIAKNFSPKNKMAARDVSTLIRMHIFRGVKKWRTNRKRSSFATKHFQRKSLKIFDLHPLLRRLVSFVTRIITCKVRC